MDNEIIGRCSQCGKQISADTFYEEIEESNRKQFICEPCVDRLLKTSDWKGNECAKRATRHSGFSPDVRSPKTRPRMKGADHYEG